MIPIVCFVAAAAGSAVLWAAMAPALSNERFTKTNFRGESLSGVGGVPLVVASAIGSIVLISAASIDDIGAEVSFAAFQLAVGFGVLGFLDDVAQQPGGGGFGGHLRALRDRRVTTGLVKLAGGLLLSLFVSALVSSGGAVEVFRDAAIIAGGANLANLFDRAPGRSLKVAVVAGVWLVAAYGLDPRLGPGALALGAGLGLAPWDLREAMMLGDTGVNVLGAMIALSAVVVMGDTAAWVVLGVVVALNLVSEVVSFTAVINRTPPLRWADRLGRPAP